MWAGVGTVYKTDLKSVARKGLRVRISPSPIYMNIGIVGSEAFKFTPESEAKARSLIRGLLSEGDRIISGGCHLGGIDIWAKEEGKKLGLEVFEFLPATLEWKNYAARNRRIANNSQRIYCITVSAYPPGYKGMQFATCYHCKTDKHVKSGGCWTVKYAIAQGIPGQVLVIDQ